MNRKFWLSNEGLMRRIALTAAHELRVHGYKEKALEIAERAISWYKAHKDEDYRNKNEKAK